MGKESSSVNTRTECFWCNFVYKHAAQHTIRYDTTTSTFNKTFLFVTSSAVGRVQWRI